MTVEELIEKLQKFSPDMELAVNAEFGLSEICGAEIYEETVRYLSVDYGGDYHIPTTMDGHEYSHSRDVKGLVVLKTDN
tara:strand:+ start:166 stop:402 length:237 start_codon:yes stop_codon:yes gene_type:complete